MCSGKTILHNFSTIFPQPRRPLELCAFCGVTHTLAHAWYSISVGRQGTGWWSEGSRGGKMSVTVCRTTHESVLRQHAAKVLGCERLALMSDKDVRTWLDGEGYQSYVEYTGEYDDSDDILIAKPSDIETLVSEGKAFWATRSGRK